MQTELIKTESLRFSYDESDEPALAVNGVDLKIERGSFVAITGKNGCGKSTLAKCMNAILLPSGGAVFVDGMNTAEEANVLPVRKTVGMVFQNPDNQLVSSVVEDDIAFGPENLGVEPAEIRRRVDTALKSVGMYEHRKKSPHMLSGGQKQRIAIAGVLAMQPSCIIFDEPTAMLDPAGRKEILDIISRLHSEGTTVLLITHFMEEAASADRMIVMSDGKIVLDDLPSKVFADRETLLKLGLCLPFAAEISFSLREKGLNIDPCGSAEELCDSLCKLK